MMFRTTDDFLTYWKGHTGDTEKLLNQLTDPSLSQPVSRDVRTLGRLAWHIVVTIPEMMREAGLPATLPPGAETVPHQAAVFREQYRAMASQLASHVRSHLSETDLRKEIPMYGETWTLGQALFALVAHEIHHRGQLTILMRQAGLKVPGLYGPAQEEWSALGMPAPVI